MARAGRAAYDRRLTEHLEPDTSAVRAAGCRWPRSAGCVRRSTRERLAAAAVPALRRHRRRRAAPRCWRPTRDNAVASCFPSRRRRATPARRSELEQRVEHGLYAHRRRRRRSTCTRCGTRPGTSRVGCSGRVELARPGRRRHPAAREHHGRAGRRPARGHDRAPAPTSSRSTSSTTAAARRSALVRAVDDASAARRGDDRRRHHPSAVGGDATRPSTPRWPRTSPDGTR